MAKRLRLFDKQGNPVVFDISSASVTIDAEGKSLDVKLSELVAAIASAVKSVTFNGNSPAVDANGNVNLGKQMSADWNESNPNWPSFIANKPTVPSKTSQLQNDSGYITASQVPSGEADSAMSSTSERPVQNKVIKEYVDNLIAGLIDGAPAALDTLKELATALGNNSDAIATIVNSLSSKANASEVYSKSAADAKFVEQVPNKGLSTNDYTTADQQKVTSALQGVKVNGSELQKDNNNKVNILVTDGKSAYQSYLDTTTDNPKKTEAQWLASLKGADGNSGVGNADNFESVNNLDGGTTDTQSKVYVLGANQGKVLADMIEDLALEVAQKGGGVTVSHRQGVTNIIIGGGGSSVETTAAPSISVANSGLNKVVTITNDEDETGATIYYTLDGSVPTVQSEVYLSPITISEAGTTTVKAIAKASGKLASSSVTQSVYIEPNNWTDGVRFTRNTNGGTTNATGYSISPFIPVNDSDLIWLWCGILLADTINPYAFLIQYDENKDYNGQFFSVNYDWKYPLSLGTKYIRFVAKTEDKQKCFVYKYTNDVAGDATGVFLFKGNNIDAATYGKMCGFTFSDTDGSISRRIRPSSDAQWADPTVHKVVTGFFDVSKYSSIDIKHGFGGTDALGSTQIVRFYDSSYQSASGKYYTLTDNRTDPRVGMSLSTLGSYPNARFQINGLKLHSCYAIGHWTDENNVEHEEYIWKGCDVVTEEEEENVE